MLITGRPYSNRDRREAFRMAYRSDAQTQEAMRIQSEYRRALLREVSARRAKVNP